MRVLPQSLTLKMEGAISLYHSFLVKGSTAFLRLPFLDFVSLLFLPIAILIYYYYKERREEFVQQQVVKQVATRRDRLDQEKREIAREGDE
mmetsp:Transcript_20659/g.33251  ORF Transcript_20659/g.33251 Transcript_20659/m.33251 type:complete len:91 (-) Transcript_20659:8-280(-)